MSIFRQQFSVAESCMRGSLFMQFLSMAISLNNDISQGSVVTQLRCGGTVNEHFVANILVNLSVEEF